MKIFILEHHTDYENCSYVIKAFESEEDGIQYVKDNYKDYRKNIRSPIDVWEIGNQYITLNSTELVWRKDLK